MLARGEIPRSGTRGIVCLSFLPFRQTSSSTRWPKGAFFCTVSPRLLAPGANRVRATYRLPLQRHGVRSAMLAPSYVSNIADLYELRHNLEMNPAFLLERGVAGPALDQGWLLGSRRGATGTRWRGWRLT